MPKELISAAEIALLVSHELEKHPACEGVSAPDVLWCMDDGGCNWVVHIWKSTAPSAQPCEDCIKDAVQRLRAQYNVFQPG